MQESVVTVSEVKDGIVEIKMCDQFNKNTFSSALIQGLSDAFEKIEQSNQYKVVILTGYGNYFASGGTKENLLEIQSGKVNFNSGGGKNLYSLALDCKIPVISAMQGHAIGGGLALGLFADIIIMSRESIYTASFMKYGFTPGMGATLIIPEKIGTYMGEEMMLTARTYYGWELEKRGVPFLFTSRDAVKTLALEMAEEIAQKPREALILLKEHLVRKIRAQLDEVIKKEVELHEMTFHNQHVRDNILNSYGVKGTRAYNV